MDVRFATTTRTAFTALQTKDDGTLYFMPEEQAVYKGTEKLFRGSDYMPLGGGEIEYLDIVGSLYMGGNLSVAGWITSSLNPGSTAGGSHLGTSEHWWDQLHADTGYFRTGLKVGGVDVSLSGHSHDVYAIKYGSGYGGDSLITAFQNPCTVESPHAGWTNSWASFITANHGDGATYYNQTLILPFWGVPHYSRLEGGTQKGPYKFWTEENANRSDANWNAANFLVPNAGAYLGTDNTGVARVILSLWYDNVVRLYSQNGALYINPDSSTVTNINYNNAGDVNFHDGETVIKKGGNAILSGYIVSHGSAEIYDHLYHRKNVVTLAKSGSSYVTWATRNTSGSETVMDLSNVGTILTTGTVTIAQNSWGSCFIRDGGWGLKLSSGDGYGLLSLRANNIDALNITSTGAATFASTVSTPRVEATWLFMNQLNVRSWNIYPEAGRLSFASGDGAGIYHFDNAIEAYTAKLSNLTAGYIPYHTADGLVNSGIYTDGTNIVVGSSTLRGRFTTEYSEQSCTPTNNDVSVSRVQIWPNDNTTAAEYVANRSVVTWAGGMGLGTSVYGYKADIGEYGGWGNPAKMYAFYAQFNTSIQTQSYQKYYGLYLASHVKHATSLLIENWGVYQADELAKNYFAGNVGIGTTTPRAKLEVSSSTNELYAYNSVFLNPSLSLGNSSLIILGKELAGAQAAWINYRYATVEADRFLGFGHYGKGEAMVLTYNGNVGIGTTEPIHKLDVFGGYITAKTNISDAGAFMESTNGSTYFGNLGTEQIFFGNASGFRKVVITNGGNVGIGTISPSLKLEVDTTTSGEQSSIGFDYSVGMQGSAINSKWYSHINAAIRFNRGGDSTGGFISFWTEPEAGTLAERLRILSNGFVGIGYTADPSTSNKFAVNGSAFINGNLWVEGGITVGDTISFDSDLYIGGTIHTTGGYASDLISSSEVGSYNLGSTQRKWGAVHAYDGYFTMSLSVNGTAVSLAGHTHSKSNITDFPTTWAWASLSGVPSTFTPSTHTHDYLSINGGDINGNLDVEGYIIIKGTGLGNSVDKVAEGWFDELHAFGALTLNGVNVSVAGHGHAASEITGLPTTWAWSALTGVPTSFTPSAHSHTVANISNFPTTWAWASLSGVPSTFTPASHTHTVAGITDFPTNLWTAANSNLSTVDWTAKNSIVSGYVHLYGELLHRSNFAVLNNAGTAWTTWATRNTSGSAVVMDLSNLGTIYGKTTLQGPDAAQGQLFLRTSDGYGWELGREGAASGAFRLREYNAGTTAWDTRLVIKMGGNVGIGYDYSDSFSSKLAVNGTIYSSGLVTSGGGFTSSSRRALKINIEDCVMDATRFICNIAIKEFRYKTDPSQMRIGIIADDTDELISGKDKSMHIIDNSVGLLLKSVQELNTRLERLEQIHSLN